MADKIPVLDAEPDKITKYYFRVSIPSSVNHTYNVAYREGKPKFYMNHAALETKKILMQEFKAYSMNNHCPLFKNTIVIADVVAVNLKKNRDLSNLTKTLWDALQEIGIIDNDKNLIDRFLYKKYNENKESYLEIWLYEPKGIPDKKDIEQYFFWLDNEDILKQMKGKI